MNAGGGRKVLVLGGCRSGKSEYALRLAEGRERKVFIATAEAGDEEMRTRIERHKRRRGRGWITVEEPIDPGAALARSATAADAVVLDCVTLWLSNLLLKGLADAEVRDLVSALAVEVARAGADVAVVANEVGSGVVPAAALSRRFRDLAGWANQRLAAVSGRVVIMVAGLPVTIKGGGTCGD